MSHGNMVFNTFSILITANRRCKEKCMKTRFFRFNWYMYPIAKVPNHVLSANSYKAFQPCQSLLRLFVVVLRKYQVSQTSNYALFGKPIFLVTFSMFKVFHFENCNVSFWSGLLSFLIIFQRLATKIIIIIFFNDQN